MIGGTNTGEGNTVAFNKNDGISLASGAGSGNAILGNIIHSNGTTAAHLGIDLNEDGVTTNDAGDADTGPNNRQNFPVLSSSDADATQITIDGSLNSTASTNFRIEFFSSATADPSGNGEGQTYLGFTTVTTDGSGNATFNVTLKKTVSRYKEPQVASAFWGIRSSQIRNWPSI